MAKLFVKKNMTVDVLKVAAKAAGVTVTKATKKAELEAALMTSDHLKRKVFAVVATLPTTAEKAAEIVGQALKRGYFKMVAPPKAFVDSNFKPNIPKGVVMRSLSELAAPVQEQRAEYRKEVDSENNDIACGFHGLVAAIKKHIIDNRVNLVWSESSDKEVFTLAVKRSNAA